MNPTHASNITPISSPASSSSIAEVISVADDHLRVDLADADVCIPFTQCTCAVQGVRPGSRVLVRLVEGLHIVEARLLGKGERPVSIGCDADGNLVIEATQALRLRAPKAEIFIDADGDLTFTATNIDSDADHENRIAGSNVKLN